MYASTKNCSNLIWSRVLALLKLVSIALVVIPKADIALPGGTHIRATGRHLPRAITQRYLPPNTSECALPNPSHAGWYSIYLPGGMEG